MKRTHFYMKKINGCGASILAVLLALAAASFAGASYADEKFAVKEAPLAVEHTYMRYEKLIPAPVDKIIVTPQYAAFISSRNVWIAYKKKQPVPLSGLVKLPQGFDWYETACALGDKLLISVGSYTEEQRQKDLETPRGGYIEGPRPVGMLLVELKPPHAALVTAIKVTTKPATPNEMPGPDQIAPKFQSCFWDGKDLYIGEYGYLARVNTASMTAELLEFDEMQISRLSIWKEGTTLWYAADEGGLGGSWISKLDVGGAALKRMADYTIMNDGFVLADAILRYKGRLLTSSLAGLVEIDEGKKTFIQYQLTKDPKTMRVYKLSVINGQLWGLREDGWVRFDPDKKTAVHYHLQGAGASNNIYSIGYFDGQWFIGTDKEVVRLK